MAVAVVQSQAESAVFAASATLAFASAPSATDLVIIALFKDDRTAAAVGPSGFTLLSEVATASGNWGDYTAHIWYGYNKTGNSYTASWTGDKVGRICGLTISGADGASPIDVAGAAWQAVDFGALTITGITTATDGALHVLVAVNSDANQNSGALTGYAKYIGASHNIALWTKAISPAGATGNKTVDFGTEFTMRGIGFAVKPAGGGPGPTPRPSAFRSLLGVGF